MAPSGTLSSATNVSTNQAPVVMADGQFNDGYVSISAYLGPTRSPRSGTVTTCTCRGAPEAIGAPSHHLFLLAEALRKPWITPIGQNRRKWRAFPRGTKFTQIAEKQPRHGPRGKARRSRRCWPIGATYGCFMAFASRATRWEGAPIVVAAPIYICMLWVPVVLCAVTSVRCALLSESGNH